MEKPLNYQIPKKKVPSRIPSPDIPVGFEILSVIGEESHKLTAEACKRLDKKSHCEENWKYMKPKLVHKIQNERLEARFEEYKRRTGSEEEFFAYREFTTIDSIKEVAKSGLRVDADRIPDIGDPAQGVVVYTSPAVAHASRFFYSNITVFIVIFRTVRGSVNYVGLNTNSPPSKEHNCHIPCKTKTKERELLMPNGASQFIMEHRFGSVYHYEFEPNKRDVEKYPASVLPYAIIEFKLDLPKTVVPRGITKLRTQPFLSLCQSRALGVSKYPNHRIILNDNIEVAGTLFKTSFGCLAPVLPGPSLVKTRPISVLSTYKELSSLRCNNFGELLERECVNTGHGTFYYYQMKGFTPKFDNVEFVEAVRRNGDFLMAVDNIWKVFFIPNGEASLEFGFANTAGVMHVIAMRSKQNGVGFDTVFSAHASNQKHLVNYINQMNPNGKGVQLESMISERLRNRKPAPENHPSKTSEPSAAMPVRFSKVDKSLLRVCGKGILKKPDSEPRKLRVVFKEKIREVREFSTDPEYDKVQHNVPNEQPSMASGMRKNNEREEFDPKEEESDFSNNIFKNMMRDHTDMRIMHANSEPHLHQGGHANRPGSATSFDSESVQTPQNSVRRNMDPRLMNPLSRSMDSSVPRPGTQPLIPERFNHPPPPFVPQFLTGTCPPPIPAISFPKPVSPPSSVPLDLRIVEDTNEDQGSADMDVSSEDPHDTEPTRQEEVDEQNSTESQDEVNEILRMAFEPFSQPSASSDHKPPAAVVTYDPSLLPALSTINTLSQTTLQLLDNMRKKETAQTSLSAPSVMDSEMRMSSSGSIAFAINRQPTAKSINVFGEEDDDDEEDVPGPVAGPRDVDYRKIGCLTQFTKDRDDRPKDIDERCRNIPLPRNSIEEANRNKKSDHLQESLRAKGKTIDNDVDRAQKRSYFQQQQQLPLPRTENNLMSLMAPHMNMGFSTVNLKPVIKTEPFDPYFDIVQEPEQIRSPSPMELDAPTANNPVNIPNPHLPIIMPTEPLEPAEHVQSPRKGAKRPHDYNDLRSGTHNDERVNNSWQNTINQPKRVAIDIEEGELDSDEASGSPSYTELDEFPTSRMEAPAAPPGISLRVNRNDPYSAIPPDMRRSAFPVPHFSHGPRASCSSDAQLSQQHQVSSTTSNYRPVNQTLNRFRGRGAKHQRFEDHRVPSYDRTDPEGYLNKLTPFQNTSAAFFSIFIDPNLSTDQSSQYALNALLQELVQLKRDERFNPTIYMHSKVYGILKKNQVTKIHQTLEMHRSRNLVEVLPEHSCDETGAPRIKDLGKCMLQVNKRKGGRDVFFLTQSKCRIEFFNLLKGHTSGDPLHQDLRELGIHVMTIRQFGNHLRSEFEIDLNI